MISGIDINSDVVYCCLEFASDSDEKIVVESDQRISEGHVLGNTRTSELNSKDHFLIRSVR